MDKHKERIIDEAITMFMKHGIRSITMDDIAKQCGISKRTLYESFKDKEDLLMNCVEKIHLIKKKNHQDIVAQSENVIEVLLNKVNQVVKESSQFNPTFQQEITKFYPAIAARQEKYFEEFASNEINRFIKKGMNQGLFRNELDVDIVTRLLMGQIRFVFFDLMSNSKFQAPEVFQTMILCFTRGISTSKGLEIIEQFEKTNMKSIANIN